MRPEAWELVKRKYDEMEGKRPRYSIRNWFGELTKQIRYFYSEAFISEPNINRGRVRVEGFAEIAASAICALEEHWEQMENSIKREG